MLTLTTWRYFIHLKIGRCWKERFAYLQTWRLKLSYAKTVTTAFHLHNRKAKRELKVKNNVKILPLCPVPTYLGVKLDRALTYRHHLEALRKKISTSVSLLRQLAGSGWGADAKTLRTAALSLIYSTAECCTPAWCRSAHTPSLTTFFMTLFAYLLDACIPLQRTTFQFSQAPCQPSIAAKEQHSPWLVAVLWTLATFS